MRNWVMVRPGEARKSKGPSGNETGKRVKVTVHFSPYDKPLAVRGRYDEDRKRFLVEFQYIADEDVDRQECGDYSLILGRNSGRLYGIEIDVDRLQASRVELMATTSERALDRLISDVKATSKDRHGIVWGNHLEMREGAWPNPRRQGNYELAREAVRQHKHEIFSGIGK
jgi:hypothetical protein